MVILVKWNAGFLIDFQRNSSPFRISHECAATTKRNIQLRRICNCSYTSWLHAGIKCTNILMDFTEIACNCPKWTTNQISVFRMHIPLVHRLAQIPHRIVRSMLLVLSAVLARAQSANARAGNIDAINVFYVQWTRECVLVSVCPNVGNAYAGPPQIHIATASANAAVRSVFLGTRALARACTSTKHPKHHVNHPYISIISDLYVMFFICVRCARAGRSSAFGYLCECVLCAFHERTDGWVYIYIHMHTHYSSACLCLQCNILYIGIYTPI